MSTVLKPGQPLTVLEADLLKQCERLKSENDALRNEIAQLRRLGEQMLTSSGAFIEALETKLDEMVHRLAMNDSNKV